MMCWREKRTCKPFSLFCCIPRPLDRFLVDRTSTQTHFPSPFPSLKQHVQDLRFRSLAFQSSWQCTPPDQTNRLPNRWREEVQTVTACRNSPSLLPSFLPSHLLHANVLLNLLPLHVVFCFLSEWIKDEHSPFTDRSPVAGRESATHPST